MAEVKKAALESQDPALLASWRRFLDYDQVSSNQKQIYSRLREVVIALGLLTSAGAVISIFLQQVINSEWIAMPVLGDLFIPLGLLLRIMLIIMPIASVFLMRYATLFASSTSWIEYRVGAETLRSHIYLYRMRAGEYKNADPITAKSKLLDAIDAANTRIDEQTATVPYMQNYDDIINLVKNKTETPDKDNGLSPLTVQQYIDWRVQPQLRWYIQKIQRDYSILQREQALVLAVGGLGAVLSGINFEALVALTAAMSIALTSRSETRMYGATYGIFHWTAGKLQHHLHKWEILPDEAKQDVERQLEFVEAVENVFTQERELWRAQAIQSQSNSDNTINNQLQKRVSTEDLAAHQSAGLVPTGIPASDTVAADLVNYSTTQSMRVLSQEELKQMKKDFVPPANGVANEPEAANGTEAASVDAAAQAATTDAGTVIAETLIGIAESGTPAAEVTANTDATDSAANVATDATTVEEDPETKEDLAG